MAKPKKTLSEKLTPRLLERLRTRKITNREAAEGLGVSSSYLSRTVAAMQKKEPGKTTAARKAAQKLYAARIEFRDKLAKQVLAGRRKLETACEMAQCTQRTMFRHMAKYREQAHKGPKGRK